jgi:hypothetical protein
MYVKNLLLNVVIFVQTIENKNNTYLLRNISENVNLNKNPDENPEPAMDY